MNEDNIGFKYQLILGDYVIYTTIGGESRQGYVIGMSFTDYFILDIINQCLYIEYILNTSIAVDPFFTVEYKRLSGNLSSVKRLMNNSSSYICNKLCEGLKKLDESCEKYCPCRKINEIHTILPLDKLNIRQESWIIYLISFIDPYLLIKIKNKIGHSKLSDINLICEHLRSSFSLHNIEDNLLNELRNRLDNPNKYNIYKNTHYLLESDIEFKPYLNYNWHDIKLHESLINSRTFYSTYPNKLLCQYCIFDVDYCKEFGCKLNIC